MTCSCWDWMVTYSCSDCIVTCSDHMVTCSCSDCIKKFSYLFHGDMFLFRLHGDIFMFHGDMFMFRLHCDLFTLWCHLHHFIQRDQTACHCPTYTHTQQSITVHCFYILYLQGYRDWLLIGCCREVLVFLSYWRTCWYTMQLHHVLFSD